MADDQMGKWILGILGAIAISLLIWGGTQLQKLPVIEWRLGKIEAQLDALQQHNSREDRRFNERESQRHTPESGFGG